MKARTLKSSTRRTRAGARGRGDQHLQAISRIVRASESADNGRAAERLLFVRYQRNGDMAAREELVKRFLPLARRLARRYERASEPLEDLVQVASVGLVKAIDRFETEQGTGFSSYAVPTILGELKRHFRDSGWALHVPRGMQEEGLTQVEIAERIGISQMHVSRLIRRALERLRVVAGAGQAA